MVYFGRIKGLSKAASRSWSENYLERAGIPEKAKTRLDKLSGGQQQKVQLGVSIMNNPELGTQSFTPAKSLCCLWTPDLWTPSRFTTTSSVLTIWPASSRCQASRGGRSPGLDRRGSAGPARGGHPGTR